MKKSIYILLMMTNGILWSVVSSVVFLAMILTGHKPKKYGYSIYFEVGKDWGGLELGWVFLCGSNPSEYILNHEAGHSLQMAWLGFLFLPLAIWSSLRYWYRRIIVKLKPGIKLPSYDCLWFEGWATKLGYLYFNK